ncbi:MAG TPA: Uma2 family endonuclease [Planctomycetaceae bacterium]|nr:Uma2 family endonuclease [Planctomycetaceae bacterium]HQZ66169.1 Uma2 family endonuclease [Planctomycetaceae bacterium]
MQTLISAETRTVMENIRWETFVELAEQRRGSVPRMTFDEGVLELMSPRRQHENIGRLIGRLVETYTEALQIEVQSVASTTFKRKDLQKAFEADESYYIEHAELIRPKEEIDLTIDPPPDLVIEVEITSSAIRKLKLFAAMGVPEVWRHDGEHLQMFVLENGQYEPVPSSPALPGLTVAAINALLEKRFDVGETALIREFRRSLEK